MRMFRLAPTFILSAIWGVLFAFLIAFYSPADATAEPQAYVTVYAKNYALVTGHTTTVTVGITSTNAGCSFHPYTVALTLSIPSAVTILSPSVIGPPVPLPPTFTLQAISPGTNTINAKLTAEWNCGYWFFRDYVGVSPVIVVADNFYQTYLPLISR